MIKALYIGLIWVLTFTSVSEAKPNLILLSIGVNHHAVKDNKEDIFAQEATHLEGSIDECCQSTYNIKKKCLHSALATKQNCLDGLKWTVETAGEKDVSIVYIGSHGTGSLQGNYAFYSASGTISSSEIISSLKGIKGSLLLLVDTCHAGAIIIDWHSIDNVSIISCCRADKVAYIWGFVIPFGQALLYADYNKDKAIDLSETITFVIANTREDQSPITKARFNIPISEEVRNDFRGFKGSNSEDW